MNPFLDVIGMRLKHLLKFYRSQIKTDLSISFFNFCIYVIHLKYDILNGTVYKRKTYLCLN